MNKVAVGTIIFAIIILAILYRPLVFPLISALVSVYNNTVAPFLKPSSPNLLPITYSVLVTLYNWLYYVFTHPLPLAIVLAIAIMIWLLEFEWRK